MTTQTITETEAAPEIVDLPMETPRPMKLSEAMRLGSLGTVQAHGAWTENSAEGEATMCAMSTAWYALTGHKGNDASNSPLVELLEGVHVTEPVSGQPMSISSAIITLNDSHRWTRPQIADWLETLGL